jgi:hypothetical protein
LYLASAGILSYDVIADIFTTRNIELKSATMTDIDREELSSLRLRITLELDDQLQNALQDKLKDVSYSKLTAKPSNETSSSSPANSFGNSHFVSTNVDYIANHMTAFATNDSSTATLRNTSGVVSRTVECLILHKTSADVRSTAMNQASPMYGSRDAAWGSGTRITNSATSMSCFEHIETPIQQLKRASLGLLSQGLGRLGFGAGAAGNPRRTHPAAQTTVVIVVIGGISLKEVAEVQALVNSHYHGDEGNFERERHPSTKVSEPIKVILGSTCLTSSDLLFRQIYGQ